MQAKQQSFEESLGWRMRECLSNTGCDLLHCIPGGSIAKDIDSTAWVSVFHRGTPRPSEGDSRHGGRGLQGHNTG